MTALLVWNGRDPRLPVQEANVRPQRDLEQLA